MPGKLHALSYSNLRDTLSLTGHWLKLLLTHVLKEPKEIVDGGSSIEKQWICDTISLRDVSGVGVTTVFRDVHARTLDVGGGAQNARKLHGQEENRR